MSRLTCILYIQIDNACTIVHVLQCRICTNIVLHYLQIMQYEHMYTKIEACVSMQKNWKSRISIRMFRTVFLTNRVYVNSRWVINVKSFKCLQVNFQFVGLSKKLKQHLLASSLMMNCLGFNFSDTKIICFGKVKQKN